MKNKKLALLLPLLPLLMANSAVRRVSPDKYEDFAASYVGEEIVDNYRYQVFHVKNTGKGYMSYFAANGKLDYDFNAYANEGDFYPLFENTVIAPNQEIDVKVKSNTPIVAVDSNELEYRAYAYISFVEEATVSGSKDVELLKEEDNYCYYSIDAKVENAPSNEPYCVVFKATYDGNDFYLKVNSSDKLRFYTSEKLDLSKLEISGETAVLKDAPYDNYYDQSLVAIGQFFLRLLIIFIVIIFCVGSLIFLTIFLPKIIRKKYQRKRDLQRQQNNQENKGE